VDGQLAVMVNSFIQASAIWVWLGPVAAISDLFMDVVYEVSIHPEDIRKICNLSFRLPDS
jgi:hypothetical protein